jgi:hypothetical protein
MHKVLCGNSMLQLRICISTLNVTTGLCIWVYTDEATLLLQKLCSHWLSTTIAMKSTLTTRTKRSHHRQRLRVTCRSTACAHGMSCVIAHIDLLLFQIVQLTQCRKNYALLAVEQPRSIALASFSIHQQSGCSRSTSECMYDRTLAVVSYLKQLDSR